MTSLIRWDPFEEFRSLRRAMDRLWEDFLPSRARPWEGELAFPVDLYETDEALVAKAALPGLRPEDVDISISGNSLTIKGELKHEEKVERQNYYRREMAYGAFSRTVPLPTRVDQDKAEAEFENGVLTVTLPKVEEVRAKAIKIRPKPVMEGN